MQIFSSFSRLQRSDIIKDDNNIKTGYIEPHIL